MAAAGVCDAAESCTGEAVACPADGLRAEGEECRAAAGVCDVAESCRGDSVACPLDALVDAGSECRAAAGVCDAAESCTGDAAECPVDALVASGTECRGAVGECDLAEICSGLSAGCPADAMAPDGMACTDDRQFCSGVEVCQGGACLSAGPPCAVGEVCGEEPGICVADGAQSATQALCIAAINKTVSKLALLQGRENLACLADAARGRLGPLSARDCLAADRRHRLAGAEALLAEIQDPLKGVCPEFPDFAFVEAAEIRAGVVDEQILFFEQLVGSDLEAAVATAADPTRGLCQKILLTTTDKLVNTGWKEFVDCKRAGLLSETDPITNQLELGECLGSVQLDLKKKVAKAVAKLSFMIEKKCSAVGVGVAEILHGPCGSTASVEDAVSCLATAADCHVCRMANLADGLVVDCDSFDDGLANGSCAA